MLGGGKDGVEPLPLAFAASRACSRYVSQNLSPQPSVRLSPPGCPPVLPARVTEKLDCSLQVSVKLLFLEFTLGGEGFFVFCYF